MSATTTAAQAAPRLRSSGHSPELRGLAERVDVADWLTVKRVAELVQAAGYPDSVDTIRRRVDAGEFGARGQDWYRSETGYRYVKPAAVEEFLRKRQDGQ